jgi:hypothetical protein
MKPARIILHGLLLLLANLTGVYAGFIAHLLLGRSDQLATQLPIAIVVSIFLYLAWAILLLNISPGRIMPQNRLEYLLAGICSLLWNPVVFIPLHYATQGYLTAAGNILVLAVFQIAVNAVTMIAAWKLTQSYQRI